MRYFFIILILFLLFNCALPADKEKETSPSNEINGFFYPKKLQLVNNNLYVLDSYRGIYRIDLSKKNLDSNISVSSEELILNSKQEGYYPVDFKVITNQKSEIVFSIVTKNEGDKLIYSIYRNKIDGSNDITIFKIPLNYGAFYLDVTSDNIFLSGNVNCSLNIFATSGIPNYIIDSNYNAKIKDTENPGNIAVLNKINPYIYLVSRQDDNKIGIKIYKHFEKDKKISYIKNISGLKKYPFVIKIIGNYLYCGTFEELLIYKLDDPENPELIKNIKIRENIGIFGINKIENKLICAYSYEIKQDQYEDDGYDELIYWSEIKIFSNPETDIKEEHSFTINGWVTDSIIYKNYVISASQSKSSLVINKF